jgi:hypothetical protein
VADSRDPESERKRAERTDAVHRRRDGEQEPAQAK